MCYLFICLALLFSCGSAKAQLTVPQPWYTSLKAPVSYVGPGDLVSGATAWYGLRAYSAAVAATGTQSAVDLRRASDNATCTAKIATNGSIDLTVGTPCSGATVTAFCNATTCLVSKWYDQSGNLRDASQGTAANQPQLVLSGGPAASLPYVLFSGSQWLAATVPAAASQPVSWSVVARRDSGTSLAAMVSANSGSGSEMLFGAANKIETYYGIEVALNATDVTWHAVNSTGNGASSSANIDGAASSGNYGSNGGGTTLELGRVTVSGSFLLTGRIFEAGYWRLDTSASAAALNANQHAIGGGW